MGKLHVIDLQGKASRSSAEQSGLIKGYGTSWEEMGRRMDAPGLGRCCVLALGGRTETEAAEVSHWMLLH